MTGFPSGSKTGVSSINIGTDSPVGSSSTTANTALSTPRKASPVNIPAASINVPSNMIARVLSASLLPSSSRILSIFGASLFASHQSLKPPPISIGKVAKVGRYIPSPKDVPIPVAHSMKQPSKKPNPNA